MPVLDRNRGSRRLRQGVGAVRHLILTVTDNGSGTARVTCPAPHGKATSDTVTISGNSNAVYNTAATITVISAAVFDTDFEFAGAGTGGRWD